MSELKVAVYCRVSTNHEEQESSLEAQISYYERFISDHEGWKLVKIYAERASGAQIKNRTEFMKMLKACKQGKIDLVITKSISRFDRNTLDILKTLYELFNANNQLSHQICIKTQIEPIISQSILTFGTIYGIIIISTK